jgi:hypothetical protein
MPRAKGKIFWQMNKLSGQGGGFFAAAITKGGDLYVWGKNEGGELGVGESSGLLPSYFSPSPWPGGGHLLRVVSYHRCPQGRGPLLLGEERGRQVGARRL